MIDEKTLKEHGFSTSVAQKGLTCCIGWFSEKYKHTIKIGELIYWRQTNRPMGHCEECMDNIIEQERKQGRLFQ